MDKCYRCGAETCLYDRDLPICLKCVDLTESEKHAPKTETTNNRSAPTQIFDKGYRKPDQL